MNDFRYLYKFKDKTDGQVSLVLANNYQDANRIMSKWTALDFDLVAYREAEKYKLFITITYHKHFEQIKDSELPLFLVNNILPF